MTKTILEFLALLAFVALIAVLAAVIAHMESSAGLVPFLVHETLF